MKNGFIFVLLASVLMLTVALPQASAQVADGTHSLDYQVNQPNSSSASIANDYFLKPAKATVKNGVATVGLTLKNSTWITKFQPPGGATVLSEDKAADTRVVQFTVNDLSKPLTIEMKVDVDDINYHHEYSVDLVFDEAAAVAPPVKDETVKPTPEKDKAPASSTTGTKKPSAENQVKNPQTSDSTPYLLIFALAGSAFLLYRTRNQRKQGEQS
ncbi:heme uptake protein IsdC [Sporosarcina cascadiensis]|uniref:heme uptake protein IsdC n=1 Tax=Sporosarcina cascadiensis TaxID=2660747 RepID=UPI00129B9954|nr:heme uptake protein IsdC [Sporosarcina cascadiensis]